MAHEKKTYAEMAETINKNKPHTQFLRDFLDFCQEKRVALANFSDDDEEAFPLGEAEVRSLMYEFIGIDGKHFEAEHEKETRRLLAGIRRENNIADNEGYLDVTKKFD
jgi:hypothetical protein